MDRIIKWNSIQNKTNYSLLIAGKPDDVYLKEITKVISKQTVIHPGFIPDNKIQLYMRAADCLILPYRQSLTSGVAVLALGYDLPIVATDNVAFHHLVENNLCICYRQGNENDFNRAIEEILLWDISSFKARCDRFINNCNWENVAKKHEKVFNGYNRNRRKII